MTHDHPEAAEYSRAAPSLEAAAAGRVHRKLDTDSQVFFYEQEFYVLSNFSAFAVDWNGYRFPTAEHAYHWAKFVGTGNGSMQDHIRCAPSAHEAFRFAREYCRYVRSDWMEIRVGVMRGILVEKVQQHEYVRRKLLETGSRELVEDSWRDDFWGWGEKRDGQNMLGKLWMDIRAELRSNGGF